MSTPTIDTIIPVFNGSHYIMDALDSVNQQTHRPNRIIVVDDGSTDTTQHIIQAYKSSIPLTYIHQDNKGPSTARNTGIKESTADYIALLDADDQWEPEKIASQLAVFKHSTYPNLGVVFCDFTLMNQTGEPLPRTLSGPFNTEVRGDVFQQLLIQNEIASSDSGVLIRRSCFNQAGLFDESLPIGACEDWDMWLRLAQQQAFDYVASPLVRIRRHPENNSANLPRLAMGTIAVLNKYIAYGRRDTALLRRWEQLYFSTFTWLVITHRFKFSLMIHLRRAMNFEVRNRYLRSLPRQTITFFANRLIRPPLTQPA